MTTARKSAFLAGLVLAVSTLGPASGATTIISDNYSVTTTTAGFTLNNGVNYGINPPMTRLTGTARANLRYIDTLEGGRSADKYGISSNRLRVESGSGIGRFTLSADGETLYFGAMNGETWYQVPARLLRAAAEEGAIAAAIVKAGPKPMSDGASTDAEGNHYFTDLANNAITVLHPDGRLETLVRDERLSWPDALSFGEPGWLYIAVNQLHRAPMLNGGVEGARPPFRIMRVYTGTEGIAGR